jgi:hypothetical protein
MVSNYFQETINLLNVVSARIGFGIRELFQASGYTGSAVLLWQPGHGRTQSMELDGTHRDRIERLRLREEYPIHWRHLRVLLIFATTEHAAVADARGSQQSEPDADSRKRNSPERYHRYQKGPTKRMTAPRLQAVS